MARPLELLADTSGIIALLDRDDKFHIAAVTAIRGKPILIPSTTLPALNARARQLKPLD